MFCSCLWLLLYPAEIDSIRCSSARQKHLPIGPSPFCRAILCEFGVGMGPGDPTPTGKELYIRIFNESIPEQAYPQERKKTATKIGAEKSVRKVQQTRGCRSFAFKKRSKQVNLMVLLNVMFSTFCHS